VSFVTNYVWNLGSVVLGRQPRRPLLFSYYVTHRCELRRRYCTRGRGHVFCHKAPSLLQRRPIPALGELRWWRN